MHWDGACYFRHMAVHWKRFILILVAGAVAGLAWNAASGRGFALGRSVLVQTGDELVAAADAGRHEFVTRSREGHEGEE